MTEITEETLAQRIKAKFPEGLTGVLALGGTRTSYILSKNRDKENPGKIDDFGEYVAFSLKHVWRILTDFYENGAQNLVVALFSYQGFYERSEEYATLMMKYCLTLMEGSAVAYYKEHDVDPYFVGIDTLLQMPEDDPLYEFGKAFEDFHATWDYQEGRRKLIWEVAPIPLFSFWKAKDVMPEEETARIESLLANATDLEVVHDELYAYYAKAVYGTDLPMPRFYLGTNRNGDMKFRAMLPLAMICGGPFRMFYTPYSSLFMNEDGAIRILEDLVTPTPGRSFNTDYAGRISTDVVQKEYDRLTAMAEDTDTIIGLHFR